MALTPLIKTCAPACEEIGRLVTRTATLIVVLRKLARAWHRTHANDETSWVNCSDHFCVLAHQAAEDQLTLDRPNKWGTVSHLVPKQTSQDDTKEGHA